MPPVTLFERVYYGVLVCASVLACYRMYRGVNKGVMYLCIYIVYGLLNEVASLYSIQQQQNNFLLANLYDYGALFLLLAFYYQSLSDVESRRVLRIVGFACAVLLVLNMAFFTAFHSAHQLHLEYVSTAIIIITALYAVYRLVVSDDGGQIHRQFLFWISLLMIAYRFIALWCRSTVYPLQLESEISLAQFYSSLLINNIFYYLLLMLLLLIFKKPSNSAV